MFEPRRPLSRVLKSHLLKFFLREKDEVKTYSIRGGQKRVNPSIFNFVHPAFLITGIGPKSTHREIYQIAI
jgi:hypothetical protein